MKVAFYDDLPINEGILLDITYRRGAGSIVDDMAKSHHPLTMIDTGGGSFTWGNLVSGQPNLLAAAVGGGADDGVYIKCLAAACADLNFVAGDYSIASEFNWDSTGGLSEILIGRYLTQVDGWDLYLNISGGRNTLSQRHHHSSLGGANLKSECYSTGWTPGVDWFFGMSRSGQTVQHYRNGVPLTMYPAITEMLDPDTASRDLVLGVRGVTVNQNWYRGFRYRDRAWGRALAAEEQAVIYQLRRKWYA